MVWLKKTSPPRFPFPFTNRALGQNPGNYLVNTQLKPLKLTKILKNLGFIPSKATSLVAFDPPKRFLT